MDIYAILSTRPHNPRYLNRYIRFIRDCQQKNLSFEGYTEKHHICPKANDMFPEHICFRENPWNCAILKPRQHFIAHLLLWKVYPDINSVKAAVFFMGYKDGYIISSKLYEKLRLEFSDYISEVMCKRVENGTHHLLGGEIQKKKVEEGVHNFLGGEIQGRTSRRRVKEGTHNFLGGEAVRKRVEDGTHNWLGGEAVRKSVEDGTHNFLNTVSCINKNGEYVKISKDIYFNQTGEMKQREYVHFNTREGKKRRGKTEFEERVKDIKEDFSKSGMTRKQFALSRNINYSTLGNYLYGCKDI